MAAADTVWVSLPLALTHSVVTALYLALLVVLIHKGSAVLSRPRVRRALDAVTGTVLVAFGFALLRTTPR